LQTHREMAMAGEERRERSPEWERGERAMTAGEERREVAEVGEEREVAGVRERERERERGGE